MHYIDHRPYKTCSMPATRVMCSDVKFLHDSHTYMTWRWHICGIPNDTEIDLLLTVLYHKNHYTSWI